MTNLYEVHAGGRAHHVQTPHHHDDYDDATWKKHLTDLVTQIVGGTVVIVIDRYVFKGKLPPPKPKPHG